MPCQLDHVGGRHLAEPFGIEADFGALTIQHLEHLIGVGPRIVFDVLRGERLARDVFPGRIADHAGEVADQENHLMSKLLELTHLVQQNGMAEVQIRCSRVKTCLDSKRSPAGQSRLQFFGFDDFLCAAPDQVHGGLNVGH